MRSFISISAVTNQYSAALNLYLQAGAVCSDFFTKVVPPDVYTEQVNFCVQATRTATEEVVRVLSLWLVDHMKHPIQTWTFAYVMCFLLPSCSFNPLWIHFIHWSDISDNNSPNAVTVSVGPEEDDKVLFYDELPHTGQRSNMAFLNCPV